MKLTIKQAETKNPGSEKWVGTIEGFEEAAEWFMFLKNVGIVTVNCSTMPDERAECKDGDVLAAICKIAGMTITERTSTTTAEVEA